MKSTPFQFNISVAVDPASGSVYAVYFQVRKGKAKEVREFKKGDVFVNYGRNGELLGIEVLAPCSFKIIEKITETEPQARKFIRSSGPPEMVLSS